MAISPLAVSWILSLGVIIVFLILLIFSVTIEKDTLFVFFASVGELNIVYESSVDLLLVPEDVCKFLIALVVFSAPEKDVIVQPVSVII